MSSLSPQTNQLNAGGSATGNPRNKCALKPGHSLMDWIRLGNSGIDLTGFNGLTVPVSMEELAKHNKRDDAWLCIRGKVYNVTRYMDFHPGGVDELMRGVGRDASKLFDEVHAWVNYQQLLAKCYIGPLRNVVKVDQNLLLALTAGMKSETVKPPEPTEIVPRFDWIQTRHLISFYFYTRPNCNPGFTLRHKSAKQFELAIQIEHVAYKFAFEVKNELKWPLNKASVNSTLGKIELSYKKAVENLWAEYGSYTMERIPGWTVEMDANGVDYDFDVIANEKFNHDSFELCLKSSNVVMIPPVGFHVNLSAVIDEQQVRRSYTPVSSYFILKSNCVDDSLCLKFLIKSYDRRGKLSSHLEKLSIGSIVKLSVPSGNFKLGPAQKYRRFVLLAAGSGVTPCLSLMEHFRNFTRTKVEQLFLLYFNKTKEDIWCNEKLNRISEINNKFRFINILSQPSSDWTGPKGHISTDLLTEILDESIPISETFVAVCGPPPFNEMAENCLQELKYNSDSIHTFRG